MRSRSATSSRKTAGVATTTDDRGRHHHPDPPPHSRSAAARRPDPGLPGADPRAAALPRAARDRDAQACMRSAEYGLMHVKLYEDIARHGHIATTYAYPVKVERPLCDGPVADAEIRQSEDGQLRRRCSCSAPAARSASMPCRPIPQVRQPRLRGPSRSTVQTLRRALRAVRRRRRLSRRDRHSTTGAAACSSAPTPTIARGARPPAIAAARARRRTRRGRMAERCPNDQPLLRRGALGKIYGARIGCRDVSLRRSGPARCWRSSASPARASRRCSTAVDAARAERGHGVATGCATASLRDLCRLERGRAPLPDAHRLGLRAPEPGATACAWRSRPAPMSASG